MPNWLADPELCAVRLKNSEGGCIILAGRNEVLSRSTRVYRTVVNEGKPGEVTTWASGNIKVERTGPDQRRDHGKANLEVIQTLPGGEESVLGPMIAAEAVLASDVLRAAAVNAGGSGCGGETLLELMWAELMAVMERLMTDQAAEDGRDPGRAEGMAYAIAIMQNPYRPSVEDVREQAMQRWEEEQDG